MKAKLALLALLVSANMAWATGTIQNNDAKAQDAQVAQSQSTQTAPAKTSSKADENLVNAFYDKLQEVGAIPPTVDKKKVEADLRKQVEIMEILGKAADEYKASVTDPKQKARLQLVDAQMKANAYEAYLMETLQVNDQDVKNFITNQMTKLQYQIAFFNSKEEAEKGLELLKKGLSMPDLIKSLHDKDVNPKMNVNNDASVALGQLPPALRSILANMEEGQISKEIHELVPGKFAIVRLKSRIKEGTLVDKQFQANKAQMTQAYKQYLIGQKMRDLLKANGISPDAL